MKKHKSEDYKISVVQYYIENNKSQTNTCKIFKCSRRSLMRWVKSKLMYRAGFLKFIILYFFVLTIIYCII